MRGDQVNNMLKKGSDSGVASARKKGKGALVERAFDLMDDAGRLHVPASVCKCRHSARQGLLQVCGCQLRGRCGRLRGLWSCSDKASDRAVHSAEAPS